MGIAELLEKESHRLDGGDLAPGDRVLPELPTGTAREVFDG